MNRDSQRATASIVAMMGVLMLVAVIFRWGDRDIGLLMGAGFAIGGILWLNRLAKDGPPPVY